MRRKRLGDEFVQVEHFYDAADGKLMATGGVLKRRRNFTKTFNVGDWVEHTPTRRVGRIAQINNYANGMRKYLVQFGASGPFELHLRKHLREAKPIEGVG